MERSPSSNYRSNASDPVSVDELEAILRDWNIEDGDAVISVSSSNRGGGRQVFGDEMFSQDYSSGVDVNSWTQELMGLLQNCQNDAQRAQGTIGEFLRAFELQATNAATQRCSRIANANRILLKTLKRVHTNYKTSQETVVPDLQRQVEENRTRADVAESRCKVLEAHLQHAMDAAGAPREGMR